MSTSNRLISVDKNVFTKKYQINKLVYFESFTDITQAIAREKTLKGWLRKKKVALINSVNPQWKDLSEEWSIGDFPVASQ